MLTVLEVHVLEMIDTTIILFYFQILNEIIKRMRVKDRINAKSVNSLFLRELNRRKFQQEEYIAFRGQFSSEEVEKLESLGLLNRDMINLLFTNVESFKNQPKEFWQRWKVQKVRFKGCGISFNLLQQVLQNSYSNLLEISTVGCYFDDDSGWRNRAKLENDPLERLFQSPDPPNPKRERGKIIFHKNVEQFVRRFIRFSSNMFVYCDKGEVRTFIFEYPVRRILNFHKIARMVRELEFKCDYFLKKKNYLNLEVRNTHMAPIIGSLSKLKKMKSNFYYF